MSDEARLTAIRCLSDGRWHSGEALAQLLGVSRTAVWKRLQGLRQWGLELQAVRGRGYRLAQPLELLDADAIRRGLSAQAQQIAIDIFPVLDSTNRWLLAQPDDGAARLCLAEYQSAGRGRRGRGWCSPFGANLYLSLAWRFGGLPPQFGALGLAVGVAVAETLQALGVRDLGVKWPNDLLWRERKLAGILIEHRGEGGGPARVVVGLGLNVAMSSIQARALDQPWATVAQALDAAGCVPPGRNALCAAVADALVRALAAFAQHGFADFARRWAAFDLARDRPVRLEQEGQSITGVARGVDGEGALLLETASGLRRCLSGDLSLRFTGNPG
ncbi:MAG TPA: bifunctional biotin--[acetyl-CoA-carboxylase] ligase/biotin operon repressor BirA [Nevskiales bacterium]|nr:bifunctional biotin--[acetyl-CoA-carboxylase] ligase/biotin operon repressor BirA [Nevskiales bacterium]